MKNKRAIDVNKVMDNKKVNLLTHLNPAAKLHPMKKHETPEALSGMRDRMTVRQGKMK